MTDSPSLSRASDWILPRVYLPIGLVGPLGAFIDVSVLLIASAIAQVNYNGWRNLSGYDVDTSIVASLVFLLVGKFRGLYTIRTLAFPERELTTLLSAILFVAIATISLLFVLQALTKHSRGVEFLVALYAMPLAPLARVGFAHLVRFAHTAGRLRGRCVVLIGEAGEMDCLTSDDWLRFGVSETTRVSLSQGTNVLADEDRARILLAIRLARLSRAAEFALLIPWPQDRRISETLEALRASPLGVRLYPDLATRGLLRQAHDRQFDPYMSVKLRSPPLGPFDCAAKRSFDLVVATIALAGLAPALLLVALIVRMTSRGPAIFRQTRRGFDGSEFRIWKFRTMKVAEDGPHLQQAARDDPRVTSFGKWLRRMSLDELPQLVNVLKGEMSLIGPRPHALAHDDAYGEAIREYGLRRHVKPGLTGAAQAAGLRGETRTLAEMQERVARDLWYIDNWSIWLDIRIAFQTLFALFKHEAY